MRGFGNSSYNSKIESLEELATDIYYFCHVKIYILL